MMPPLFWLAVLPLAASVLEEDVAEGAEVKMAPPVKEVSRVLAALQKRVDVRSRREDGLYEEFRHYCGKGRSSLEKSLKESEAELPQLQLQLVEADRKRRGLLEEIQVQEKDAAACKSALQSARAIGSEEFKSFQKDLAAVVANAKRLKQLLDAQDPSLVDMGRGVNASSDVSGLQHLTMSSSSSSELLELLQDPGATAEQKIQVVEMVRTMLASARKEEAELRAHAAKRLKTFEAMERAKVEELQSLQRSLQEKRERDAAFQKQLALLHLEREDTALVVDDASKLTQVLRNWCDVRRKQHSEMELKMQEETKTLQSASKMLRLGLLAGASFASFQPTSFLQLVRRHNHSDGGPFALRGKGTGALKKITKLVDSMVEVLQKDQEDDELKVQMCKDEMASTKSSQVALSEKEESEAADGAALSEHLENLEREVLAEKRAIARVDWLVATATSLREKEHKHLANSIAQGAAAVDVLYKATNSLERHLKEGGTLGGPPAVDDDDFGFFTEAKSDPTPALRSLSEVISAVKSEVEQVKLRESTDQTAYEALLQVAKGSRRKDAVSFTDFVGGQASLALESQRIQDRQKALKKQMGLTDELASTLQAECEQLLRSFEEKKRARGREIQALDAKKKALEVSLTGVDLQ